MTVGRHTRRAARNLQTGPVMLILSGKATS